MSANAGNEMLQRRTAAHYDAYPFDFLTPEDEASIANMQPPPFLRFLQRYAKAGMAIGEIGCGPGRGTMYMAQRGFAVTALDLSSASIRLARGRSPDAQFVQGSNLALPFADRSFDIVVSDGVIHHTPNAERAFVENARVLKADGHYYLGVYNRHRYYYYLYTYLGTPLRWLEKFSIGRVLIYATVFPLYYFAHVLKSRGKRTVRGARNFFYDYIMTPRASFHTRDEIARLGARHGLELLDYDPSLGNVHVFFFKKSSSSASE